MEALKQILEEIRPDVDFDAEEKLIDDGILDSIDIISIVTEVNDAYDVDINIQYLLPENFNSINAIYELICKLFFNAVTLSVNFLFQKHFKINAYGKKTCTIVSGCFECGRNGDGSKQAGFRYSYRTGQISGCRCYRSGRGYHFGYFDRYAGKVYAERPS